MGYCPDKHDEELTGFFDWILFETDFKRWYFGHWHTDKIIDIKCRKNEKRFRPIFYDLCKIDEFK